MTVIFGAVCSIAAFGIGYRYGKRKAQSGCPQKPPVRPKRKTERLSEEYRNFLRYDGTAQQ